MGTKPQSTGFYEAGNGLIKGKLEVNGGVTVGGSAVALAPGVTGDGDEGLTINEALSVGELATLTGGAAMGGDVTMADAKNIAVGTGTGTKIGTGATQKIGFYGHAPIAQAVLATGAVHTADDIITFLQAIGLCKQS